VFGDILAGLRAQVSVQCFNAARETHPIMNFLEDFDSEVVLRFISKDHLN
jgi:hypothetical protein